MTAEYVQLYGVGVKPPRRRRDALGCAAHGSRAAQPLAAAQPLVAAQPPEE